MATKEEFKSVFEDLIEMPIINGKYDAKNGSREFMHGIALVLEYIACKCDMEDEFDNIFFNNIEKSIDKYKTK